MEGVGMWGLEVSLTKTVQHVTKKTTTIEVS